MLLQPIRVKAVVLALFLLSQLSILGQDNKVPSPWKLNTALGFSYFEGNVEKLNIRYNIGLSRKDSVVEYSTSYKFIYGEFNKDKNNLMHDFKFTTDFLPHHTYSPFAGFFLYNNIFKGFRLRNSYLLGVKRKLFNSEHSKLSLSAAIMYDYITYGSHKNSTEEPDLVAQVWRFSVRPKIKVKLDDGITFSHISFWQPEINDLNNYIYTATTSLDFDVKKNLALGIDYLYYFNSAPPYNSIRKRDQKVLLSIKYSL